MSQTEGRPAGIILDHVDDPPTSRVRLGVRFPIRYRRQLEDGLQGSSFSKRFRNEYKPERGDRGNFGLHGCIESLINVNQSTCCLYFRNPNHSGEGQALAWATRLTLAATLDCLESLEGIGSANLISTLDLLRINRTDAYLRYRLRHDFVALYLTRLQRLDFKDIDHILSIYAYSWDFPIGDSRSFFANQSGQLFYKSHDWFMTELVHMPASALISKSDSTESPLWPGPHLTTERQQMVHFGSMLSLAFIGALTKCVLSPSKSSPISAQNG